MPAIAVVLPKLIDALLELGEGESALVYLRQDLAQRRREHDRLGEADIHINMGKILFDLGHYQCALDCWESTRQSPPVSAPVRTVADSPISSSPEGRRSYFLVGIVDL